MKIGILTFHWAVNYGAILQAYALQEYLKLEGHDVCIVNYKPKNYDDTILNFIKKYKFLKISEYLLERKKELSLSNFREKYLNQTERVCSCKKISNLVTGFDVLISGSDQVLNPYFLATGEGNKNGSSAYYLGFNFDGTKIAYAVSFGCVTYPEEQFSIAAKYLKSFSMISVRENTGKNIVSSMGIKNVSVAPDPTLLMPYSFFDNLADQYEGKVSRDYTYCFFIRNMKERKSLIKDRTRDLIWNNDLGDSSVESWLYLIKHANSIITDSFHCVVMCLKFHIPFVVITELNGNVGMNDRFYTLLTPIKMVNRILYKNSLNEIEIILSTKIDWNSVDMYLNSLRNIGKKFLNF